MSVSRSAEAKPVPGFRPDRLLDFVGEDRELLGELIGLFEQESARLVDDARRAAASLDGEALERSAHSLKGMLSHFGDSAALDLCRRLEELAVARRLAEAEAQATALDGEIHSIRGELARLAR